MFHLSYIKDKWIYSSNDGHPLAWIKDSYVYDMSGNPIMWIKNDYMYSISGGICQYFINNEWIYKV